MQDFEHYIKSNYNIPNATACSITYTYNYKLSQDKKSHKMIINHTIKMTLVFIDKDGKQIYLNIRIMYRRGLIYFKGCL